MYGSSNNGRLTPQHGKNPKTAGKTSIDMKAMANQVGSEQMKQV